MRRAGSLMPQIVDYRNLTEAFTKAARGKREQLPVRRFEFSLAQNLTSLGNEMASGEVEVGDFHRFTVRDPKVRVIHAASFRERVLHHAIMNLAGAIFERGAIDQSYACRIGKGNQAALFQAKKHTAVRAHFLKLDIRRFFDSIDHAILQAQFRRLFKDPVLLHLLDRIVDSFETEPGKGLPIGSLTSQYFANFYLDRLDRFIKEQLRCRDYVRFMDDFVLWHDDASQLAEWLEEIRLWLTVNRQLMLKPSSQLGRSADGLLFLGYRLLPGRILLGRGARKRFRRRLREMETAFTAGEISEGQLQRRAMALIGFTDQACCHTWRGRVVRETSIYPE